MKPKTIRKNLRKKFAEWLDSIPDADIKKIAQDNTIITGGSIASMLLQEDVNDYDIYFKNKEAAMTVAKYYTDKIALSKGIKIDVEDRGNRVYIKVKSSGIAEDKSASKFQPAFVSGNAISLNGDVQLIVRFFGEPEEIHKNYDFVHCTNYWTSWDDELILRQEALEALMSRELKYIGSRYPLCSIIRTRKFIKRGFTLNAGQYVKMALQLQTLDLTDPETLEDQLMGVDSAYFMTVIEHIKSQDLERVEASYLIGVIDRVFDEQE